MSSLIRDPNAIVRVKNNMTGESSHFMFESTDGQRKYHIEAGKTGEMRWKDWLDIQQYPRVRDLLSLDEGTFVNEDGEIMLDGMNASEIVPIETMYEIMALPQVAIEAALKTMTKTNLLRIKKVAEEQDRRQTLGLVETVIKSRGGRPRTKTKSSEQE